MRSSLFALLCLAGSSLALPHAHAQEVPLTEADLAAMGGGSGGTSDTSSAPLSTAELQALGLTQSAPAVDKSLQFSGFADFTLGSMIGSKENAWRSFNVAPSHASFYLGNINLYLSKYLTEKLFTLGEVRFSYLPNGSTRFGVESRTSTEAYDYADFGRVMRWGGIEIERFVLDWIAHPQLTVRVGQFLTPYGIWNVDHGSPTFIPPRRPWIIGSGWFPERQTGVELFGGYDVSAWGAIGYHLTLSNGTGPVSEYQDLDDNKAVGARLYWDYRRFGRLRVGASAYYGRETSTKIGIKPDAQGAYKSTERIETQHDALALAGDVRWTHGGWHLQSEVLVHQRAYTKKGRTARTLPLAAAALPSDRVSWGAYALAGYRFPWLGVMPFLLYERSKGDLYFTALDLHTLHGGLNIRPVDVLTLKLSYEHVITNTKTIAKQPLRQLQAQVAWAF